MELQAGMIVKNKAGRDTGMYFVVLGVDGSFVTIANGKERKLEAPKRKNIKHLQATKGRAVLDDMTNRKLRAIIRDFTLKGSTDKESEQLV